MQGFKYYETSQHVCLYTIHLCHKVAVWEKCQCKANHFNKTISILKVKKTCLDKINFT